MPLARVAAMPPIERVGAGVDREEEAGVADLVVDLRPRHARLTVTVRSSALTASTLFMRDRSMLMPPWTASRWPSSDEPTPNGITGTA